MSESKKKQWGEHWGEINVTNEQRRPTEDSLFDMKLAMSENNTHENILNEDSNDISQLNHLVLESSSMDPIMLYAISLHKFAAEMSETVELTVDSNVMILQSEGSTPVIPQPPFIPLLHAPNTFGFIERNETPFTKGIGNECPELSNAVAKKILMQSTATMLAHIGFEQSHSSVLTFLTDVLDEFMKKLCGQMKDAKEQYDSKGQSSNYCNDFPVYADKVLQEIGLEGFHGVHDYYQNRVLKYVQVLYRRCEELVKHYEKLLVPTSQANSEEIEKSDVLEMIDMEL